MRILGLISKYFLILMIIEGFVVGFVDSKRLKKANMKRAADKSKAIGVAAIIVSIILYLLKVYVT